MLKEDDSYLRVTNRFVDLVESPGVRTYGQWNQYSSGVNERDHFGLRIVPEEAPWRALFTALDEAGASLPDDPVTTDMEANAIVACCWRFGSYANVLCSGEYYPPFRKDPNISRLHGEEMMRLNLEFSSGLAAWWTERAADPAKINRRIRAAHEQLPISWPVPRPEWWQECLEQTAQDRSEKLRPFVEHFRTIAADWIPEVPTVRDEANWAVQVAYRRNYDLEEGSIEGFHSGGGDYDRERTDVPGYLRLYPREVERICRSTSNCLAPILAQIERETDPCFRRALIVTGGISHTWNRTEETCQVDYLDSYRGRPVAPRLRWLAERYPVAYGSAAEL